MSPNRIHELAQQLIDKLEKEIETIQGRIEGVALFYKALAEEDGRRESSVLDTEEKREEASGS